jgi:SAM-dependent methyltransferase
MEMRNDANNTSFESGMMVAGAESNMLPEPRLDRIENYPDTAEFLQQEVLATGAKYVADIGGGASPALDQNFLSKHQVDCTLLDISRIELDKASSFYRKIEVDLTAPAKDFLASIGSARFDIVYSHFFLEHVRDPIAVHRNIHAALNPGGLAIHFFPTPNNFPLAVNRLIPDWVSSFLVTFAQPERDRSGIQGKFPAYYAMCSNSSVQSCAKFRSLGFDVIRHTGYIGHGYYDRVAPLRRLERALRPILLKAGIPLTADALLVLRKQTTQIG